jgi:hypothetical protein
LRDERHAVFHRGEQACFPEREEEGEFAFHWRFLFVMLSPSLSF